MTKKNLFLVLLLATAMTGAMVLSSCSHSSDAPYDENNVKELNHAKALAQYQQTFVKMFGQPASDQSWDFTLGNSHKTRAKKDNGGGKSLADWPKESYNVYGYTWKFETGNTSMNESKVNEIFDNGFDDLVGLINAATPQDWNPKGTYKFRTLGADICSSPSGKYYTLGADLGGNNNYILRQIKTNGSTRGVVSDQHTSAISFDNINKSSSPVWFTVATGKKSTSIDANANKIGKFVEIKHEYNNKVYTFWGFKVEKGDKGSYADLVLWVDEIEAPTYYYAKRFFVEDLGGASNSDIDFNDIVFDVVEYTNKEQEVIVRALGGTLPITITVCGTSWSKPADKVSDMIHTGADGKAIDYGMIFDSFKISGWDPTDNSKVSVQVEDKNGFKFIEAFPKNGDIPLMVAFSVAKPWKAERQPITAAWLTEEGEEPVED
jgi:hypothetical protein